MRIERIQRTEVLIALWVLTYLVADWKGDKYVAYGLLSIVLVRIFGFFGLVFKRSAEK